MQGSNTFGTVLSLKKPQSPDKYFPPNVQLIMYKNVQPDLAYYKVVI